MDTIIDYLDNIRDIIFKDVPFNELDALIFSRLSYINYSYVVNKRKLFSKRRLIDVINDLFIEKNPKVSRYRLPEDKKLLDLLRSSLRFKDIYLKSFEHEKDITKVKQFSAITFINKNKSYPFIFIAFEGTDGTLTGWKEDFNMVYLDSVPAQIDAAKYLKKITRFNIRKNIYIGGHSKGGNLAIYAASKLNKVTQNNIKQIYSFDGPGFKKEFLETPGYKRIKGKITLFAPTSSIIGRLLYKDYRTIIIDSKKILLNQHNIYNWEIDHNKFHTDDKFSFISNKIDKTLKENLDKMTLEEKKEFVDALFDIVKDLSRDDVINFGDGLFDFFKRFRVIFKSKNKMTQDLLKSIFTKSKDDDSNKITYIEPIKQKNDNKVFSKIKGLFAGFKKGKSQLQSDVIDYQEEISTSNVPTQNILEIENKNK